MIIMTVSNDTSRAPRVKSYNFIVALHCETAKPHDLGRVLELLRAERLPEHGVVDQFGHYLVVRDLGQVLGACGLEVHGRDGLLRSLVVDAAFRGQGAGDCLVRGVMELALHLELHEVYALTTTAQRYLERYGFKTCSRPEAADAIRDSWEVREGCPKTAALLRRSLTT
jgi:N-acetylglutamate synthase-like GNAT family acetyltransferase